VFYLNLLQIRTLLLFDQGAVSFRRRRSVMDHTLFRYSNGQGRAIDGRVAEVDNLIEAREYATRVAWSLTRRSNFARLAHLLSKCER
jgi:hypothetical protein